MKRTVVLVLLASLPSIGSAAFAGEAALTPVIALHEGQKYSPKSGVLREAWDFCNNDRSPIVQGIPCSQYNVQGALHGAERAIYLLAVNPDVTAGVAGLSCGISYSPLIGVFGWQSCSDFQSVGVWPASGVGNRITWDPVANCQRTSIGGEGAHALAGSFYVYAYSDGVFEITGNPDTPDSAMVVIDCLGVEHPQSVPPARVGFGAPGGFNPCLSGVPTLPATWGRIKQRY